MTLLGCVADDFTGGTDVAAALRRAGLSVALLFDTPSSSSSVPEADAVVVALKTRTTAPDLAVEKTLRTVDWLRTRGSERIYFKYCSTFDSTPEGNIGPVAEALLRELGGDLTIYCPASPEHGRTMYQGHLFVHGDLLSESSMRHHPLTPMTDSRIDRFLQLQTKGPVARLPLQVVQQGPRAVSDALAALATDDVAHVVTDAVTDVDLRVIASATQSLPLLTGGAGLAGALGKVLADAVDRAATEPPQVPNGPAIVLAGSCSAATLEQVRTAQLAMPSYRLDPETTPDPAEMLVRATDWLRTHADQDAVLMYSSATPEDRDRARAAMGVQTAEHLERTLGLLAKEAVTHGARRVVVAGGETSGAVVQALGVTSVLVGDEADPGVPWCVSTDEDPLALLLKSGNFGRPDLLVRAAGVNAP